MPAAHPDSPEVFAPLLRERHVALAVSGGADSVAMMCLARRWATEHHAALRLTVLTFDHRLREGSADEARQVAHWANALGLQHHVLVWQHPVRPVTGLQARARSARYGAMSSWCAENEADLLLTAHTLDDQAETVLMRLARTASPESLAAIRYRLSWGPAQVLRPLLSVRRQALRDFLQRIGHAWIEDPSNADPRFERVRVRRVLAAPRPGELSAEELAALAHASARTATARSAAVHAWLARWLLEDEAGFCLVPRPQFRMLDDGLQARVLARLIRHYGGSQPAPEAAELQRLAAWAEGEQGPPRRTLGGALIGRRKAALWITREAGRIPDRPATVPESGKLLWDQRFLIEAAPGSLVEAAGMRPVDLAEAVPSQVRRAFPMVRQPPGASAARIRFQPVLSLGQCV